MSFACRLYFAFCLAAALTIPSHAQSSVSFVSKLFATGVDSASIFRGVYAVDLNDDGVPDAVQIGLGGPSHFTMSLAHGDGTFAAPVSFTFPARVQQSISMASGDFNGDGKLDLVFALGALNELAVFLGKGDGTFQAPRYVTLALPSGQTFAGNPIVAADFNSDGKLDLVTSANNSSTSAIYLMQADGAGGFAAPRLLYTAPSQHGAGTQLYAGDYNGDDKADIAFDETYNCIGILDCATIVHVLLGDGASGFENTTPYSNTGQYTFASGDLNSDGTTDLFGFTMSNTQHLVVLYGETSGTFATYSSAIVTSNSLNRSISMADFNGDGRMDMVSVGVIGNTFQFDYLLANANPGSFTQQFVDTPPDTISYDIYPVVGDFNRDTRPDVLISGSANPPGTANGFLVEALNTTATGVWGNCAYPRSGIGIDLCSPSGSTSKTVHFNAAANSYGLLRKMELWVDGKKIVEQHHAWGQRAYFDYTASFAAGSHKAALFAVDIDNHLQQLAFNFTAGAGACTAPASPGVHVCLPVNGSTVGQTVQLEASATVTGTLHSMEVWIDGVKRYVQAGGNTINTTVGLGQGKHEFHFFAINSQGQKWETSVYATSK